MRGDSVPEPSVMETVVLGGVGNLGTGRLFYIMSDKEDYKLYFSRRKIPDGTFFIIWCLQCRQRMLYYVYNVDRRRN